MISSFGSEFDLNGVAFARDLTDEDIDLLDFVLLLLLFNVTFGVELFLTKGFLFGGIWRPVTDLDKLLGCWAPNLRIWKHTVHTVYAVSKKGNSQQINSN